LRWEAYLSSLKAMRKSILLCHNPWSW